MSLQRSTNTGRLASSTQVYLPCVRQVFVPLWPRLHNNSPSTTVSKPASGKHSLVVLAYANVPRQAKSTGYPLAAQRGGAGKRQRLVHCRSASIAPIPEGLRLEVKPDDGSGSTDLEYDEANKVVRIPQAAMAAAEGQRRTKLVLFTCNKCGTRTARLVNPVAWEQGVVFGQCSGCKVWHVLSAKNKKIFEEVRYNGEDPNYSATSDTESTPNAAPDATGTATDDLTG